jgi:ABC-2 type transport system ATP-binding protein
MVRDIIRDLRQAGKTVFLNSHLLSEVEITCDRVAFIKHGKVIRISHLHSLVEGEISVDIRVRDLPAEALPGLGRWGQNPRLDGEALTLTVRSEADLPAINRYLVENGAQVYALRPQQISLEDLFIQIVGTDGGL